MAPISAWSADTWSMIVYVVAVIGIVALMLGLSWVLGGRDWGRAKDEPFESGVVGEGGARLRFSAKFYLVAMFFVIFDVEALFLYADAPGQDRLDRRGRGVDVVAVQAETGLQPQRVAGAEADRLDVGMGQQPLGECLGLGRRDRDLEAVLAGVSGAGDEAGHAADVERAEAHEGHVGRRGRQRRQHRCGGGALQRQQRDRKSTRLNSSH